MKIFTKYIIAAILSVALALIFYWQSLSLPVQSYRTPRLLIVLIIILSISMTFMGYKKSKESNQDKEQVESINHKRVIIFALMILLYILLIKPIGYFIITPFFIISAFLFLKSTSLKNSIIIAIVFSGFIYALFVAFLKLPVPMGIMA